MINIFREKLLGLLVEHEGLELKPYVDSVGKITIGIGRNLSDNGITKEEAVYLCYNDINNVIEDLYDIFPEFDQYPENVKIVLCDMMFNLGKNRFLTFKKFIQAIKNRDWNKAAEEMMDSKWAKQVKRRAIHDRDILLGKVKI